jgi:hypothetical protein
VTRSRVFGVVCATVCALGMGSCGGGEPGLPAPTAPSGPTASLADLQGNWAGVIRTPKPLCLGFTWSPALGGPGVTGPSGIIGSRRPTANTGTTTGTLSANTLSISLNFPVGAFGANSCSMTGTGTVQASQAGEMSGTIAMTWTSACPGVAWDLAITNDLSGFNQTGNILLTKGTSNPSC